MTAAVEARARPVAALELTGSSTERSPSVANRRELPFRPLALRAKASCEWGGGRGIASALPLAGGD
jgi:hypothetical protein